MNVHMEGERKGAFIGQASKLNRSLLKIAPDKCNAAILFPVVSEIPITRERERERKKGYRLSKYVDVSLALVTSE